MSALIEHRCTECGVSSAENHASDQGEKMAFLGIRRAKISALIEYRCTECCDSAAENGASDQGEKMASEGVARSLRFSAGSTCLAGASI